MAKPLPGVLSSFGICGIVAPHLALAKSSREKTFRLKTDHLDQLTSFFLEENRIFGDDGRLGLDSGKLLPDVFLLALQSINSALPRGEKLRSIQPEECLVFEDSVAGVEAVRRAGMRVVWCPHPVLRMEFKGREAEVLADRGECLPMLESFAYAKYGFVTSI